jgi:hypothetical protein
MNQDPVRVSQVHWTRVFPMLRLLQAASLGCGLSAFSLAYTCLLVSWTGASLANHLLSDGSITAVCEFPWQEYAQLQGTLDPQVDQQMDLQTTRVLPAPVSSLAASSSQTLFADRLPILSRPLPQVPWLLSLDLMIWNALVLGFFGTAIARSVASSFCSGSRSGVFRSLACAVRHLRATLLATGLMVAFLGILCAMLRCAEWVTSAGAVGQLIVSVTWGMVFCIAVGLILVFVIGGLAWLLSLSATGTDSCTGADALSRCISYLLSHRLWSAFGLLTATMIAVAARFLSQVIIRTVVATLPAGVNNLENDVVRRFWIFLIELIPHAVHLSVFLSGITILYVLLRRKEDGIATSELDGAVQGRRSANRDD